MVNGGPASGIGRTQVYEVKGLGNFFFFIVGRGLDISQKVIVGTTDTPSSECQI